MSDDHFLEDENNIYSEVRKMLQANSKDSVNSFPTTQALKIKNLNENPSTKRAE